MSGRSLESVPRQSTSLLMRILTLSRMSRDSAGLHIRAQVYEVTQLLHINEFQHSAPSPRTDRTFCPKVIFLCN